MEKDRGTGARLLAHLGWRREPSRTVHRTSVAKGAQTKGKIVKFSQQHILSTYTLANVTPRGVSATHEDDGTLDLLLLDQKNVVSRFTVSPRKLGGSDHLFVAAKVQVPNGGGEQTTKGTNVEG